RPDGSIPLIGDDDGGRLMPFDAESNRDFGSTVAVGAALFQRGDWKYIARGAHQDLVWLLGPRALQAFEHLDAVEPARTSVVVPKGGYHVMRDGWSRDSNYLLIDCGPHGALAGGHAHSDALAITVSCAGRNGLEDPGTGAYTADPVLRARLRSSTTHNTVSLDGLSSSEPGGPFNWASTA